MNKEQLVQSAKELDPKARTMLRDALDEIDGQTDEQARTDAKMNGARNALFAASGIPLYRPGDSEDVKTVGGIKMLSPKAKLFDHVNHNLAPDVKASELDFGRWLKGICTGRWDGAEAERKSMSVGGDIHGGYLVPSPLSASVIDLARNQSVCFRAGAQTIVMDSNTLDIARLTSDPTGYWKRENVPGTPSDITLGRVQLKARTLMALVKASVELIEDAPNAASVITNAMGQALALELDRAALRGSGAGEEPLGIRNWTSLGADFGAQLISTVGALAGYDDFSDAVQLVQLANGPSAGLSVIYSPREAGTLDRFKDGEGKPLIPPPSWGALAKYVTNQIPIVAGKTEAYVGDFSKLGIGVRNQLRLEVSREAADADNSAFRSLQVWLRAYLRADIVLLQPNHFVLLDGITV